MAHEVRPSGVAEIEDGDPEEIAVENARRKALAVPAEPGETVLGVDTVVALGSRIYGQPADAEDARATIRALAGRTHAVVSGLAVVGEERDPRVARAITRVRFRPVDDALLDWYVAAEEWHGRAGGYAIQGRGAALVDAIDGDYTNVVGLPVPALLGLLPGLLG